MENSNTYDKPQVIQQLPTNSYTINSSLPPFTPSKYDEPIGYAIADNNHCPPPAYTAQTANMSPGQGYVNPNYFTPGEFTESGHAPTIIASPGNISGVAVSGVKAVQQMPDAPDKATQQPTEHGMLAAIRNDGEIIMIGASPAPSKVNPRPKSVIVGGIIASICCFWLFGIPAIVLGYYAMKTEQTINGDWKTWQRARKMSLTGSIFVVLGLMIGCISFMILCALLITFLK